jgi:HK97 family phage prohead protease
MELKIQNIIGGVIYNIMEKEIRIKSFGGSVKDVDPKGRTVTGYFSTWGFMPTGQALPDSDGDVMDKGAFSNTLKQNGPETTNRIWHLFNHDTGKPIGKPSVLKEDETGLYFETKFPDTVLANDILKLYQSGSITEHSIGFNIIQSRNEQNYQLIQEVRLWEGSSVLWGANEITPTTGIKSEEFTMKTNLLNELMRNGTLSDETFEMIEKLLKDIQAIYKATGIPEAIQEPDQPATRTPEAQLIEFYKSLNI